MNLIEAIKAKSKEGVTAVVERALGKYKAECPAEPCVETAYGETKISMLLDDDSKWEVVTAEAMDIVRRADNISDNLDKEAEIAKMIATSAILRNVFSEATGTGDFL